MKAISLTCAALLIAISGLSSSVAAQSNAELATSAGFRRGTIKVSPRYFNPFNPTQASRFSANPFGLPVFSYSKFNSPLDAPASSSLDASTDSQQAGTTASPQLASSAASQQVSSSAVESEVPTTTMPAALVIAPLSAAEGPSFAAAASGGGFPCIPRPVRSPYRPPPRGSF